ncbi:RING-H2 finger protein ATL52 [Glycine soja]
MELYPWLLIARTLAAEGTNQTECVICLTSFEEEESVRKPHTCRHIFHTSCIDQVNSPNSRVALDENDRIIKAAEGTNQTECVICLTSFEEEESVRKLHTCRHIFHTSCIDKWLGSHSGCPLCRTQIDKVNSPNSRVALEENDRMIMVIVNS